MSDSVTDTLLRLTGASAADAESTLQTLWSGYGEIRRYRLQGAEQRTVIVKRIHPPSQREHPRGWNTDIGHRRKLQSYQVETAWYRHYAGLCGAIDTVPRHLGDATDGEQTLLVLEDLDAAGYGERRDSVSASELRQCIQWLAHFHARFLGSPGEGLWPTGTYWHLDTRPEEWQQMPPGALKDAARAIDQKLAASEFITLVHGDAKVENFCFSNGGDGVAAVDFQYVGRGCGMKDLAYLMSSCLTEAQCREKEAAILNDYFSTLAGALKQQQKTVNTAQLEADWRALYPFAWADFYRFLVGWMPGHRKIHGYSSRMVEQALARL